MSMAGPLVDGFGRVHTNLRISVTDRCNIRCFYCMPAENVRFLPRSQILTFEEITRVARVAAGLGVNKLRLTGGEPLVRHDLARLVRMLTALPGVRDVALTTNGLLLEEQADALRGAGLRRINISLDSLSADVFRQIARREGLERVLAGIEAARRVGFERIRLNAVAIRGLTEPDVVPLVRFARERGLEMRFIEFMPLDADGNWQSDSVLSGTLIRELIERDLGPLRPVPGIDPSQPASDYEFADGGGRVGFINPVTQPFCGRCNRLRLTAEGQLRNCLFSTVEWDARAVLRGTHPDGWRDDERLAALLRSCVADKRAGHGIDTPGFVKPERAMFQIGG